MKELEEKILYLKKILHSSFFCQMWYHFQVRFIFFFFWIFEICYFLIQLPFPFDSFSGAFQKSSHISLNLKHEYGWYSIIFIKDYLNNFRQSLDFFSTFPITLDFLLLSSLHDSFSISVLASPVHLLCV